MNKALYTQLPASDDVLVLRTDFNSNDIWESICEEIKRSGKELGFQAHITFCNDRTFDGFQIDRSLDETNAYKHPFLLIIDSVCVHHPEHPILCVDLFDEPGKSFRFIPAETWVVENNLSIANMDFDEFYNHTDGDGIFRGF